MNEKEFVYEQWNGFFFWNSFSEFIDLLFSMQSTELQTTTTKVHILFRYLFIREFSFFSLPFATVKYNII